MRKGSACNTDLFLLYLQTGSREQRLAQAVMQGEEYTSTRKHDGCCACVPVFCTVWKQTVFFYEKSGIRGKERTFIMLYQICNGAVKFAAETVLEHINFEIRKTEKIAVVGRNGCGKTTLLKLIAGEVELSKRDSDEDIYIAKAGKPVIGYLKQNAFEDDTLTMEEEVRKAFSDILQMKEEMERLVAVMDGEGGEAVISLYVRLEEQFAYLGGYTFEKEYEIVLKKLGFAPEDKKKKLSEFSGGQQTKIAFARMLLSKPDILLLDEPTNHLDMATINWLEGYLKDYDRAVVIVSHDRMFLDRVVDVVYEIEYKTAVRYPGNYSAFMERKRLNWEKQRKDYELQQKEIERLQTLVERFKNKPTKVAMTRSKLKQIEHMVKVDAPVRYDLKTFHADFKPERESVTDVLRVSQLAIGYEKPLATVTFEQKKGHKIGIIGDNGAGKSTLLRTLTGQLVPLGGSFAFGDRVDWGYFEQQMAQYTSDKTVLDDFWEEFPDLKRLDVRSWLGAFLFGQEEVFKQINMLSGGEKVRLALAKIFRRLPNYLILDEPTNHMDIVGKESLEAMLKEYPGSVLFVSHDRYFVKEIADSLLVFEEGAVNYYPYGYEQYWEKVQAEQQEQPLPDDRKIQRPGNAPDILRKKTGQEEQSVYNEKSEVDQNSQKGYNPGKEAAKKKRRQERLEMLIEENEEQIAAYQVQLEDPAVQADYEKLMALEELLRAANERLEELMAEWDGIIT